MYNPVAKKVWPSKEEEEEARRIEEEELAAIAAAEEAEKALLLEDTEQSPNDSEDYNEATGSYSGLYGKGPVDDKTQSMLNSIMNKSSSQSCIDSLLNNQANIASSPSITPASNVVLPPEQDEIIKEANAIYERLLREAKEDEEKKAAEIEEIKKAMETKSQVT